jgi:transcriptional regulator with XRE-family HTH domain
MKTTILKQIRTQQGLTQVEVAKKANIAIRSYQNYEIGERVPNAYTAQLIAQALQTTVEKLFPLSQRNYSHTTNPTKE